MSVAGFMNMDNPVFKAYIFYSALLVLKMFMMSFLTAMQRFKHKAFANPEDAKGYKIEPKINQDVERVRRAHLNDLENITPFFVVAWLYTLTNPAPIIAINLFRVFTICRYIHTYVYAIHVIPQPSRALAWGISMFINLYMTATAIINFM